MGYLWATIRAMSAAAVPPDATLELAKVVAVAIAAGTVDREELFDIAHRVVGGHERMAQRLGFAVASAVIDALQAYAPVAPWDALTFDAPTPAAASPLRSPATIAASDVRR